MVTAVAVVVVVVVVTAVAVVVVVVVTAAAVVVVVVVMTAVTFIVVISVFAEYHTGFIYNKQPAFRFGFALYGVFYKRNRFFGCHIYRKRA